MILFRKIIKPIAWVISLMIPYQLLRAGIVAFNETFAYSLKRALKSCGKNFYAEFPTQIIGGKFITIGNNFSSFSRLRLEAYSKHLNYLYSPHIKIGNNVSLNFDCHIGCINRIIIGDNVLIASKVFISDHYHGEINSKVLEVAPAKRKVISPGEIHIEDNVWIGEGVAILPNVRIGKNAIIGANSVVTKDIPSNSVAVGVPAKVIRSLTNDYKAAN